MSYATEFFAVQNALGIENASEVSDAPFKSLDERFKAEGRLADVIKVHPVSGAEMRGVFVDGEPVVIQANGQTVSVPSEKAKIFFAI